MPSLKRNTLLDKIARDVLDHCVTRPNYCHSVIKSTESFIHNVDLKLCKTAKELSGSREGRRMIQ